MPTVLVAGATGYLGRHLVATYLDRGWTVRALVRDAGRARRLLPAAATLVEAEATRPETLTGCMAGCDLVVSALGLTRQKDGLTPWDVDFQANANLLDAALAAGVPQFAYVHVLNADRMAGVPLVDAKAAFVDRLRACPIAATVIEPTGYFSDMADLFEMARGGRVWLFGDGATRLNPIHGTDLAEASADAIAAALPRAAIGGPEVFTLNGIAQLAATALGRPARVTHLPDGLRRAALAVIPRVLPVARSAPLTFFLSAMAEDMVAPCHGTRRLADHFAALAQRPAEAA